MKAEGLVEFSEHMVSPVLQPEPASEKEEIAVTFYSRESDSSDSDDKGTRLKAAFKRLARDKRGQAWWHYRSDEAEDSCRVEVKHKAEGESRVLKLKDLRNSDNEHVDEESEIRRFVTENMMPLYVIDCRYYFKLV